MMWENTEVNVGGLQLHDIRSAEMDILRCNQRQSYLETNRGKKWFQWETSIKQ